MFTEILRFELRQQLRAPLFWIFLLVFAGLGFGMASTLAQGLGSAVGATHYNAPVVIASMCGGFSVLSMLFVAAFVANALLRDFNAGTADIMFSTPVSRRDYIGGRFVAGYLIALAVAVSAVLGMGIGIHMPWVDASKLGPPQPLAYLWGLGVLLVPDMLFVATLLFLLASATRSMLSTLVGVIAFMVLRSIASHYMANLDDHVLAALLDPFGTRAVGVVTRYWTASDFNHRLPTFLGLVAFNRLLWLGVAAGLAAAGMALFRADREGLRLWPRRWQRDARPSAAQATPRTRMRTVTPRTGLRADLAACLALARQESRQVMRGITFLILLGLALCLLLVVTLTEPLVFGTTVYPVTRMMLSFMRGATGLPLMIVMAFYAGQLVWRARDAGMAEVIDATPVAGWVPLASKVITLTAVALVFQLVAAVFSMGFQLVHGYTHLEPLLYLQGIALGLTPFVLIGILALVLQVIANQRFIGYMLIVLFLGSQIVFSVLHWNDNLYQFASDPGAPYSDMNGWGHFIAGDLWFQLYWSLCALFLLAVARLFVARGTDLRWGSRLRSASRRLHSRPLQLVAAVALLGFAGCGTWIYYNTHVLNQYVSYDQGLQARADYEKLYGKYAGAEQPRITAVKANVAIYPHQRRLDVDVTYTLTNRHDTPIRDLYVNWMNNLPPTFSLPPHTTLVDDKTLGFSVFRLDQPLAPGASMPMRFVIHDAPRGFRNKPTGIYLVHNGTFFTNKTFFPSIGYDKNYQLSDKSERKKYGLKGKSPRMAALGTPGAADNNYVSQDADWIDFDATVSTAADQVAMAPGYLVKTWTRDGRRYFHYRMDQKILNFYAFLSARWKVKRTTWHGINIAVYYQPAHYWNVDRMIEAAEKGLAYYGKHFSPYQYRQLRILEFPGYRDYAQSFANTVPFSEAVGFIADVRGKKSIDYPFYFTAHEVAHQWWAHQVVGANEQGATMLSESLAQYSALMVMKHAYGATKMHRFLSYELDRYLSGRILDKQGEMPLGKVENQQYIHYRKGSLVFYALQDYIGEDVLDQALHQFDQKYAFQGPPYPTSRDLVDIISADAGPKWHPLINDLFWKITLFDNRIDKATATRLTDGRYKVTMKLHAAKYYADKHGKQTRAKLDIPIEVGVFAASTDGILSDGKPLYLAKRPVADGESTLSVTVDGKPAAAGIDPFNELIDRKSGDNVRRVELK